MSRPTILVTEDDSVMESLLQFMLEREGFDVRFARDGREATRLIEEMPPPRVALMDVMLPYVNGLQLVRQIRSKAEWRDVSIVMLSAKSGEEDIARALLAGADDYVAKPFRPRELMARVRRFLTPIS